MIALANTASNIAQWIRMAATIINSMGETVDGLVLGTSRIATSATAPASPVAGQCYYNTTSNQAFYWNGTAWVAL